MNQQFFRKVRYSFLLILAHFILCAPAFLSAAAKPNILFIMSDDHTSQAIGVYGSRLAALNPTPNIDALAKGGMRFDKVFCNNSICSPSRATILTGQYSHSNGVVALGQPLAPERQYLTIEMRKAGYSTAVIGKWHLTAEPAAFDYYAVMQKQGQYFDPWFKVRGEKQWPQNRITKKGQHSSDAITDLSLDWLENTRDKSKPFMLLHHFKAPHDTFQNAKRYDDYLSDVEIPEPDNLFDPPSGSDGSRGQGSFITRNRSWLNIGDQIAELEDPHEKSKLVYQTVLKRYLRCVKGVDDNVKRLIDYLRDSGELENTVIIYTGDQGYFLGEHTLWDKRWMYEEAMRMPLIIHWPKGCADGSTNDWLINNSDFAPTILDIAGVKPPDYMQGRSFANALTGSAKPGDWRDVTYYRYWMHGAMNTPAHFGIRSERHKLIFFYGRNIGLDWGREFPASPVAWEFYDLERDPFENNNEYANPEYCGIIEKMKAQLKQTRAELGDTDTDPDMIEIIKTHWD